jgi:hypothetical protein
MLKLGMGSQVLRQMNFDITRRFSGRLIAAAELSRYED